MITIRTITSMIVGAHPPAVRPTSFIQAYMASAFSGAWPTCGSPSTET